MPVVKLSASDIREGKRRAARGFVSRASVRVPGEIEDLFAIKHLEDECRYALSWIRVGDNRVEVQQLSRQLALLSNAYAARYGKAANTRRIR